MTIKFKKWPHRKEYHQELVDITSEPYAELTNNEAYKEVDNLLKNSWLSRRVEAKLRELKQRMDWDKKIG